MTSANDIRSGFLEYFRQNGHEIVLSSPLVPRNDPTLLFTNSGMVQFKNTFIGAEQRPYNRAVTSQKCVRAGGKHNDLENVGYTARHHTFFEMLGNFSFGDYFKDVAIDLAWNLITREYGLDPGRILATVYIDDDEAAEYWRKIAGLPEERIIRIATSDNFWAMGDTGPCGPCSEIFYDHGPGIPGGPPGSADEDGDRFIEIWNLVFMQFDQKTLEERVALPKPSIDTGMGLERVAALLQGKHDNYDIDLMRALIEASAEASGAPADGEGKVSHRVIADHLRAGGFLIADGVLPSNEGRGYVLRRIMRRAMRHAHMLGCEEPLLWKLVPALVAAMGSSFQELIQAEALITETMRLEETRFKDMLTRGLRLLQRETSQLGDGETLPGEVAFRLYDTYGFPLDLTQDILRGESRAVDTGGFDEAMQQQRAAARKAWTGTGESATEQLWFDIREIAGATEFLGYSTEAAEGIVAAIITGGESVDAVAEGAEAMLVVNQTPFYAESGGQEGDTGAMRFAGGAEFTVEDTVRKLDDMHVHRGRVARGEITCGMAATLEVDGDRRTDLRANHSATHLLHAVLRNWLGPHVTQKGSLVAPGYLRFDFSHPGAMTREEAAGIETEVNAHIRSNSEVRTRLMTPDEAQQAGALALFGEKYGSEVRVVAMGSGQTDSGQTSSEQEKPVSIELCGGTHVTRTGDIGFFKMTGESAVASGVRRIEAVTGRAALDHVVARQEVIDSLTNLLNAAAGDIPERVDALLQERREAQRELADLRRRLAERGDGATGPQARLVEGVKLATRILQDVPAKELKPLVDGLKQQIGSGVVAVASVNEGRASLVVGVTGDLTDRYNAVDLVKAAAGKVGGKGGGGRPDMAQAGGPDGDAAKVALEAVEQEMTTAAAS